MRTFHVEISTASEFPTVDVQHLLFELAAQLEVRFGGVRSEELPLPIELHVKGISGTLYFHSVEAQTPSDDATDMEQFLDDLNRRLNDEDEDQDEQ